MDSKTNEILNEHVDYIRYEITNTIEKTLKSGALSGEENIHALIRACTRIVAEKLVYTKEARETYENIKHFI